MERVEGQHVTVIFDGRKCVHSRNCVLSHPEVFVPNAKGDWIFPDAANASTQRSNSGASQAYSARP